MARKVKHPEHANHERWLVSYADFITLLFAFFVVMFATSHADKDKQKVVSAAVKDAINEGSFVTTVAGSLACVRPRLGKAATSRSRRPRAR